jgi:hypothetical protein
MSAIERLRGLLAEGTPGPWRWYGQIGRHIMLTTVARGIVTVMGAKRLGMQGAEPTFGVRRAEDRGRWGIGGVMTGASALAVREVPYRGDIVDVAHPDARLIVAAVNALPALLDVAEAAQTFMAEEIGWFRDEPHLIYTQVGDRTVRNLRSALRRLGGAS